MDSLRPGDPRQIGDYLLSGRLGAGGMGEVFFGRSPGGRAVAVKVIHPVFANDAEFRRRFRQEVEAGRKVGGFHAAQVVGADPDADRPWMVTAYVAGPSLTQVLADHSALPPRSVRVLGAGLAEALQAIHAAGIVHRDLKPSNILLADDGPRVIDFGIARAIDASAVTARPGTPGFIAPEILTRQPVTPACDVFALGVVLASAGGIRPFGEGPAEAIDYRVVHEEPDLRGLDPQLRGLVGECLAKKPAERPTPTQILDRLAIHGSVERWLPEPVHDMIAACAPPRELTVSDAHPLDNSRLLAEAEQIARALPDEYERSAALVHIATAVCRDDPSHAARLLDDARYSPMRASEAGSQWRRPMVEYLIESCPVEVGTVVARIDPVPADQMLAEIAAFSRLLTLRHTGAEEETATVITTIAEAAARANPDRADRIAHLVADESLQAMVIARAAMAAAHTDPARAEQMIGVISSRIEQATRPAADQRGGGQPRRTWRRARVPQALVSAETHLDYDTARYWAALALAEIAVGAAGAGPVQVGRRPTDADHFARTITAVGASRARTVSPARKTAGIDDPARAARYLADAEQLALGIAASGFTASGAAMADLRAGARAAVKAAAARIDPVHAGALLAEAEQAARAISADSGRFESLGQVALTAACTDPPRAEQIARSLLHLPHKLGELALVVAVGNIIRAERIAATITDDYVRAIVGAALAVQAASDSAGSLLRMAEKAAHGIPARVIEVAVVTARTDWARAEQIARGIDAGPEIIYLPSEDNQYERLPTNGQVRSAPYWRARALTDLAIAAYESQAD
jgi:serine/threonine protein kinase